jgi:mono/diheme cytochrome c family protein
MQTRNRTRRPALHALLAALGLCAAAQAQPERESALPVTWAQVGPLLAQHCARCHVDGGLMGQAPEGVRLLSHAQALDASDRARIVPGQPDASELLRRIRGQAQPRMPMDGPPYLAAAEIALVERWIAQGARDADGRVAAVPVGARVRLHGKLQDGWRLDGLPLLVGPGARLDKAPTPGATVQVRGRLDAQGRVVVERIRAR